MGPETCSAASICQLCCVVPREVPMWGKKKPDATQAADPESTNLQTNHPPKPASASWEGTTKMNKDVMRPAGETADRARSRPGSSLHLKGEISRNEDLVRGTPRPRKIAAQAR